MRTGENVSQYVANTLTNGNNAGAGLTKFDLDAFRPGLLVSMTLRDDGGTEPGTEVFGKFVQLGIAVDLNGLLSGIADYVAVVAPSEMIFQFNLGALVNYAIQVISQLAQKIFALHWVSPVSGFSISLPFVVSRR